MATQRNTSAATQSIALNALAFPYDKFLEEPVRDVSQFRRATGQRKLPVVLTQSEVGKLLDQLSEVRNLVAALLYWSGLRHIKLRQTAR